MDMESINYWEKRLIDLEKQVKGLSKQPSVIPEIIKIGEVTMQSRFIKADTLLELALDTLKKKEVKEYLKTIDSKKIAGVYDGVVR